PHSRRQMDGLPNSFAAAAAGFRQPGQFPRLCNEPPTVVAHLLVQSTGPAIDVVISLQSLGSGTPGALNRVGFQAQRWPTSPLSSDLSATRNPWAATPRGRWRSWSVQTAWASSRAAWYASCLSSP